MIFSSIGLDLLKEPFVVEKEVSSSTTAYHVFWTVPYFEHYPDQSFTLEEVELEIAKLSALLWKRCNGPISLITDKKGEDYFRKTGMDQFYDQILAVLPDHSYGLHAGKYWAAGKILALKEISAPCVILDMDAVVWERLNLDDCDAMAAHTEELNPEIYPSFDYFDMSPRYHMENWDFSVLPLNTSFLYIKNEEVKKHYVSQALRFMQMERNTPDIGARCMVFAEQRMLAMCLKQMNIKPDVLVERYDKTQKNFTHLWSYKHEVFHDAAKAQEMIELCRRRIHEVKKSLNEE